MMSQCVYGVLLFWIFAIVKVQQRRHTIVLIHLIIKAEDFKTHILKRNTEAAAEEGNQ